MRCKSCNQNIPDDSVQCCYCGALVNIETWPYGTESIGPQSETLGDQGRFQHIKSWPGGAEGAGYTSEANTVKEFDVPGHKIYLLLVIICFIGSFINTLLIVFGILGGVFLFKMDEAYKIGDMQQYKKNRRRLRVALSIGYIILAISIYFILSWVIKVSSGLALLWDLFNFISKALN